ncbi:sialin-like isoform X2 [Sitodiplosis mosellana]|uniref:sialin-like isoform X2 n=1 Tax=Sitodiplosis mosellana TaxID=263140 RepID=UPI00244445DA|nr:sialin-like isoform X2 [Sitodiplosis mosellana]
MQLRVNKLVSFLKLYITLISQPEFRNFGKISTRLYVGLMLFASCFVSYMLRVNMSINILAMVHHQEVEMIGDDNITAIVEPNYGPRYNWSASEQSFLLGSYFWGYLVTSLPGGILAEWLGGRAVVGYTLAGSAVITALTPIAAGISYWFVFGIRLITGVLAGVLYPSLHNLISKWAPPDERGKFISALLGGTFGTVITWPLAGILTETLGWVYAFYVPAIITAVVTILWFVFIYDSPGQHPRIDQTEREHIEKALGGNISKKKAMPPFGNLLTSVPFLALTVLHYGNLWGLYFLITAAPKFMSEVLGFNIAQAGILASLPYLARLFSGFIFGSIGDALTKSEVMSVTSIRKSFCLFSHILPGLCLIGLAYVGHHPYWCVAVITISLGFNGASTLTNLQNSQDLAPNYAGTLYGVINFIGTTTGFLTPMVVGHFSIKNTLEEWSIIFIIAAVAYIIPAFVFILFGSGQVQPWNEPKKTDEKTSDDTVQQQA